MALIPIPECTSSHAVVFSLLLLLLQYRFKHLDGRDLCQMLAVSSPILRQQSRAAQVAIGSLWDSEGGTHVANIVQVSSCEVRERRENATELE